MYQNRLSQFLALVSLTLCLACTSNNELEDFDSDKWKESAICSSDRITLANEIESRTNEILGMTQVDLEQILGKAPRHQLGSRNEKRFYYPISKDCKLEKNKSLYILFDALGRAKEVQIVFD